MGHTNILTAHSILRITEATGANRNHTYDFYSKGHKNPYDN